MRYSAIALLSILVTSGFVAAIPVPEDRHLELIARGSGACLKGGPEGEKCYGKGFSICNKMCVSAMACATAMGMCLGTQYKACHCDGKK